MGGLRSQTDLNHVLARRFFSLTRSLLRSQAQRARIPPEAQSWERVFWGASNVGSKRNHYAFHQKRWGGREPFPSPNKRSKVKNTNSTKTILGGSRSFAERRSLPKAPSWPFPDLPKNSETKMGMTNIREHGAWVNYLLVFLQAVFPIRFGKNLTPRAQKAMSEVQEMRGMRIGMTQNEPSNLGCPLRGPKAWVHSNSHSLPIAPASMWVSGQRALALNCKALLLVLAAPKYPLSLGSRKTTATPSPPRKVRGPTVSPDWSKRIKHLSVLGRDGAWGGTGDGGTS